MADQDQEPVRLSDEEAAPAPGEAAPGEAAVQQVEGQQVEGQLGEGQLGEERGRRDGNEDFVNLSETGKLASPLSDKLLKELTKLKESTRDINYVTALKNIINLSEDGKDEVNIYLLKKMHQPQENKIPGDNPYHCIDIVGLLQRLSINKLLQIIDQAKIPNNVEIGNISIYSLLLRFINRGDQNLIDRVISNNNYNLDGDNPSNEIKIKDGKYPHFFGGTKRKKSSKTSSLKTHSINNLRWLVHIGLRSLQQINSGKKPVSRKSSTKKPVAKKPAVATKDDLLKVAKKLKLSGLSNKTKKDIAAAIRKVDVKKLNESQKKTLEKFKNMKM